MTDSTQRLVSTIIPVHNRPSMLREAVASVLAQTYSPIEVIIVDDGSTDETGRVADELSRENPWEVRVVRQHNLGPGAAREAGRLSAKGEFMQFLDSDDLLEPTKLELQVAGLVACPELGLSYGKTREYIIGEAPADTPARRTGEYHESIFPAALDGRLWATETPLFRRSVLEGIGPWSGLRVLEDWEYECRLGARGVRLHYCDEFVSDHRHHDAAREGLHWRDDLEAFRDLLTAHERVLVHARKAGVAEGTLEMKRYARNLFRLARDAGKRGLPEHARRLIEHAVQIDPRHRGEYRFYEWSARLLGWQGVAVLGERLAGWRRSPRGDRRSVGADVS